MSKDAKDVAVETAVGKVGSLTKLAARLGISRQAIRDWEKVPPKHVLQMEAISGVSRYELRPDIYGQPPSSRASGRSAAA